MHTLRLKSSPLSGADTQRLITLITWAREEGHRHALSRPEREYEASGRSYPSFAHRSADWSQFLDLKHRHYVRWPDANLPYCLNSVRAAHAVEANTCELGERIACLVMPRNGLDAARLLRLLDENSARFGDYQLWNRASLMSRRMRHRESAASALPGR